MQYLRLGMIVAGPGFTVAGASGLAAYITALACCGVVWVGASTHRFASRLAAALTIIEAALLSDFLFNWRWRLHDLIAAQAMRLNLYAGREGPQDFALGVVGLSLFVGLLGAVRLLCGRWGAFLSVCGILVSLALWCTEVVSLHAVDHILYHLIGHWTLVSFLRLGACLLTSAGILIEWRRADRARPLLLRPL